MNPTEKLELLDKFVDQLEVLSIESHKSTTWDEHIERELIIADAARTFGARIKPQRTVLRAVK